ncbi:hypothetical protein LTR64_004364 [Lithohypha guttulata]|uniref:uncharacterized protein n=1 Tax=Lithohypha guttulata TaxID=1690604 RepID=UPI002DE1CB30|nr:hypothetical protein LTR51_006341 [Lithohypha guttulata]
MVLTFFFAYLLGFATCEDNSPQYAVAASKIDTSLVVRYTSTYPPEIAPVKTVYEGFKTIYLNVVDCDYVTVENVNESPSSTGIFTTRTLLPTLTEYRIGCMVDTSVTTRGEMIQTALPQSSVETAHGNARRMQFEASSLANVLGIAQRLSSGIDPTNQNITVREFRFLQEINTALFALNICNSGLPLDKMCEYLQDQNLRGHLEDNYINQDEARNIVCFCSANGLYFNESNDELLGDLAALEYAVQTHAYGTQTLQEICQNLDYRAASMLGIDVGEIQAFVCNGTGGILPSTSTASATMSLTTGSGNSSTASTALGTGSSAAPSGMGLSSTESGPAPSSSIILGTDGPAFSSATSAAGTVGPWFNASSTATSTTADVAAMTASDIAGRDTAVAAAMFYPPRLIRERLRRHGHVG